ncbi:phosphatidylinositol transfer protein Csr1p [[Candida] anglica]|uniref:Phosphatidylinositol transfer protein Csr1p n=1 Tax=[Candida] anglica TaxID=148631 RepID=A0ABP0E6G7_9ASCO
MTNDYGSSSGTPYSGSYLQRKQGNGKGQQIADASKLNVSDTFSSVKYPPNRIQSLDREYEISLKQFWCYILKFWGYELDILDEDIKYRKHFVVSSDVAERSPAVTKDIPAPKRRYWGLVGGDGGQSDSGPSKREEDIQNSTGESYIPISIPDQYRYTYVNYYQAINQLSKDYGDESCDELLDLVEQLQYNGTVECRPNNHIHPAYAQYKPKDFHKTYWVTQRNDLLDNWFLKALRARKSNTENCLQMFTADLHWRGNVFTPNKWVLEGDAPAFIDGSEKGFIKNLTSQKSWMRGTDVNGNLLYIFRSDHHFPGDANQEEMRKWCILHVEWIRLLLKEVSTGLDTVTVLFDLTGFSMKNNDYHTMKFVAEVFEAHQPECLAKVLIYNPPWIFPTLYNIIKGWLDPDVAKKITFINSFKDLTNHIPVDSIPSFMGGNDEFSGEYVEPTKEDINPPKEKNSKYWQLLKERHILNLKFFERTKRWIETTDPAMSAKYLKDKIDLDILLAQNYCAIDPYIRSRGFYDRLGTMELGI